MDGSGLWGAGWGAENFLPDFFKFSSPIRTSTYVALVQEKWRFGLRTDPVSSCTPVTSMLRKNESNTSFLGIHCVAVS
jgi:hypothetical protein